MSNELEKIINEIKSIKTSKELIEYKHNHDFFFDSMPLEASAYESAYNRDQIIKQALYEKDLEVNPEKKQGCYGCESSNLGVGTDSMYCQWCRNSR